MISDNPADPRSILPLFVEILNCLEAVHASGQSHVPLTTGAIRIGEKGQVEILGYASEETRGTVIFGSAKYVAPEAFRPGIESQGCAAFDTYILGFIFYEFFLGSKLFRNEFAKVHDGSATGWLSWHANEAERARPLAEVIPGFPRTLSNIVVNMLEKNAEKRSKDLAQVSEVFQNTIENTLLSTGLAIPIRNPDKTQAGVSKHSRLSGVVTRTLQHACAFAGKLHLRPGAQNVMRDSAALRRRLVVNRRDSLSVRRRVCFSVIASVAMVLTAWLWNFVTVESKHAINSLPAAILTDSGEMVLIRAGEVRLDTASMQRKSLYLAPYYIDKYEVSNQQYRQFCRTTGKAFPEGSVWGPGYSDRLDSPVLNVSRKDAVAYAQWAGKWLPSSLEWKVARNAPGHIFGFRAQRMLTAGVHAFEWVDVNVRESSGPSSSGAMILPTDVDHWESALVSGAGMNVDGSQAIAFRCAASTEILETAHFVGMAGSSRQRSRK
jgi:hypothetical protein